MKPTEVEGYSGPSGEWRPGDERDVDDVHAERLLEHFPRRFERVDGGSEPPSAVDARVTRATPRGARTK